MIPRPVNFYVYAETLDEVEDLEDALYAFVSEQYRHGTLVTAAKLTAALKDYSNNPLVKTFLNTKL